MSSERPYTWKLMRGAIEVGARSQQSTAIFLKLWIRQREENGHFADVNTECFPIPSLPYDSDRARIQLSCIFGYKGLAIDDSLIHEIVSYSQQMMTMSNATCSACDAESSTMVCSDCGALALLVVCVMLTQSVDRPSTTTARSGSAVTTTSDSNTARSRSPIRSESAYWWQETSSIRSRPAASTSESRSAYWWRPTTVTTVTSIDEFNSGGSIITISTRNTRSNPTPATITSHGGLVRRQRLEKCNPSIGFLESVRVETSEQCSVCLEEMVAGEEASRLPCLHLYHETCIVGWLDTGNSCPLCRFQMPTFEEL